MWIVVAWPMAELQDRLIAADVILDPESAIAGAIAFGIFWSRAVRVCLRSNAGRRVAAAVPKEDSNAHQKPSLPSSC